jgi:hypothetical protein
VCARSRLSIQEDRGSTPGTDKASQAFHPFGVGKIGSSLYIVGDYYRRLLVSGTEGRKMCLHGIVGSYRDLLCPRRQLGEAVVASY